MSDFLKRHWRQAVPLLAFAVLLVFLGVGLKRDPREVPSPLIDKPAPALQLPRLDNPALLLDAQSLRGKPWLLNVWASWCTACRDEHATLLAFAARGRVPVYGLNYKDTPEAAQAYLRQFGNPYVSSGLDPRGRAGLDWGVYGVPETFVIDGEGRVRFKLVGPLTDEALRTQLEPVLRALGA